MSTENSSMQSEDIKRGDRLFTGSVIFVSVRCTLQYIVLPFVLPLIGLRSDWSVGISVLIDIIALTTIAYNVRRLWHTSWRWRYIGLAVVMVGVIAFMLYQDARLLLGAA
ncbi:MAG: hypothetical protein NZM18_12765 [Thermoflexales bacterium]|nr:hypothetical protein [Thermoflexales bacterium]MDW8350330.1 hypothetical protein [Anaerolineae bacterium]